MKILGNGYWIEVTGGVHLRMKILGNGYWIEVTGGVHLRPFVCLGRCFF